MNMFLIILLLGHQSPQSPANVQASDVFPVLSATFCDLSDFLSSCSFLVSSIRTGCTGRFHLFHVIPSSFLCIKGVVYAPLTRKDL